jgi:hypothetical protein
MASEIEGRAEFSAIRYAQCWEDADVLVEALGKGEGRSFVSIASAVMWKSTFSASSGPWGKLRRDGGIEQDPPRLLPLQGV